MDEEYVRTTLGGKSPDRIDGEPSLKSFNDRLLSILERSRQVTCMLEDKANFAFGYRGERADQNCEKTAEASIASLLGAIELQTTLLHEQAARF